MSYLFLLVGLFLLLIGGDYLVKSSSALAKKLNISPFLIGLTVVSFGTSAPELLVSLNAAFNGSSGLAIGNVIGSNIANVALVLGLTVLIRLIVVQSKKYVFSWSMMLFASLMFFGFSVDGIFDRLDGAFFISGLLLFLILSIRMRDKLPSHEESEVVLFTPLMILIYFCIGAAGLYFGSDLLVDNAVQIAQSWGVSEFVIGITIVALGTSLPELATSIIAIVKGEANISIGNIIGSNIFNIFAVLGFTSILKPLNADAYIISIDLPIMVGVTLLFGIFIFLSRRLKRLEGIFLISIYIVYIFNSLI